MLAYIPAPWILWVTHDSPIGIGWELRLQKRRWKWLFFHGKIHINNGCFSKLPRLMTPERKWLQWCLVFESYPKEWSCRSFPTFPTFHRTIGLQYHLLGVDPTFWTWIFQPHRLAFFSGKRSSLVRSSAYNVNGWCIEDCTVHGSWGMRDRDQSESFILLIWVCLKIGYIPNYSHLIGIMIINHWV